MSRSGQSPFTGMPVSCPGMIVHVGVVAAGTVKSATRWKQPSTPTGAGTSCATTRARTCSAALCGRLGNRVHQAGFAVVAPDRLRFDFTHLASR